MWEELEERETEGEISFCTNMKWISGYNMYPDINYIKDTIRKKHEVEKWKYLLLPFLT